MRTYKGYEKVSIGAIPQSKLAKSIKTGKLSFTADELKGGTKTMLLHPSNAKLVKAAQKKMKGLSGMPITGGEIMSDIAWHDSIGGGFQGGSLWSWIKSAAPSVVKFVKDNWTDIKPVLSKLADVAVPAVTSYAGQPQLANLARQALKLTGIGVKEQRLANLAKAREVKKGKVNIIKAGSFLIN